MLFRFYHWHKDSSLLLYIKITTTPESSLHEENLDILHYLAKTILVWKNGSFYNADFKLDYTKEFINMELVSLLGLVIIFVWPVIIIYFLIQKFKTTSRIVSFNDCVVGIMSEISFIYNWSLLSPEIGRKIQLWFNFYISALGISYCTWCVFIEPRINEDNDTLYVYALIVLCSGIVAGKDNGNFSYQ